MYGSPYRLYGHPYSLYKRPYRPHIALTYQKLHTHNPNTALKLNSKNFNTHKPHTSCLYGRSYSLYGHPYRPHISLTYQKIHTYSPHTPLKLKSKNSTHPNPLQAVWAPTQAPYKFNVHIPKRNRESSENYLQWWFWFRGVSRWMAGTTMGALPRRTRRWWWRKKRWWQC